MHNYNKINNITSKYFLKSSWNIPNKVEFRVWHKIIVFYQTKVWNSKLFCTFNEWNTFLSKRNIVFHCELMKVNIWYHFQYFLENLSIWYYVIRLYFWLYYYNKSPCNRLDADIVHEEFIMKQFYMRVRICVWRWKKLY